ncbi:hypothetical protein DL770_004062 [Monosporascus sp. CRB-9-2]|nr:hypothetical protein DL770_004062 [Monosporascus sp. CRB-9-2]
MSGLVNQSNDRIIWEGECGADPMDDLNLSSLLALSLTPTYNDVDSTHLNQSSTLSVNFQDGVDAEEHIAFEDFIAEEYLDVEPQGQEELKDWVATESQSSGPLWMEDEACLATGSHELLATDGYFYRARDQATKLRSRTSAHRPEQTKPTRRRKKSAQPCFCDVCNEEFPRPREMRRHMRKHEKPLRCQRCPASKAEKRDLLRHYRVNHPGYAWTKLAGLAENTASSQRVLLVLNMLMLNPAPPYSQESLASAHWGIRRRISAYSALRLLPFGPLSARPCGDGSSWARWFEVPISSGLVGGGGGDGGESPSFSPAAQRSRLYLFKRDDTDDGKRNPDDATHDTACDYARWWPGRGARWHRRGTRATAAASTVGGPEEEAAMNDSKEVAFGMSDRGAARSSLTRM